MTKWLKFAGVFYLTALVAGCGAASSEEELTSEDNGSASDAQDTALESSNEFGTLEQGLSNVSGINLNNKKPTYGLNESGSASSGSCTAACSKVSNTNIAGACCVCNGATRRFARSSYSATTYLCK